MFNAKCDKCGAPATVQLNFDRYLCTSHAFETVMAAKGEMARKLSLKLVK